MGAVEGPATGSQAPSDIGKEPTLFSMLKQSGSLKQIDCLKVVESLQESGNLPSGDLLHSYRKSPFFVGLWTWLP